MGVYFPKSLCHQLHEKKPKTNTPNKTPFIQLVKPPLNSHPSVLPLTFQTHLLSSAAPQIASQTPSNNNTLPSLPSKSSDPRTSTYRRISPTLFGDACLGPRLRPSRAGKGSLAARCRRCRAPGPTSAPPGAILDVVELPPLGGWRGGCVFVVAGAGSFLGGGPGLQVGVGRCFAGSGRLVLRDWVTRACLGPGSRHLSLDERDLVANSGKEDLVVLRAFFGHPQRPRDAVEVVDELPVPLRHSGCRASRFQVFLCLH